MAQKLKNSGLPARHKGNISDGAMPIKIAHERLGCDHGLTTVCYFARLVAYEVKHGKNNYR